MQAIFAQNNYEISFENKGFNEQSPRHQLMIDSLIGKQNSWQIGIPQKGINGISFSEPNCIYTSPTYTYPNNDCSSFTILHLADDGFVNNGTLFIEGDYLCETDSLKDYLSIEVSLNKGMKWYNLKNDSVRIDTSNHYLKFNWFGNPPKFSGNSGGWNDFKVSLSGLGSIYGVCPNDTILFRFTFHSDDVNSGKMGILLDDIRVEDSDEEVTEFISNDFIQLYPDPVSDKLTYTITERKTKHRIQVVNSFGQVVYENWVLNTDTIDVRSFPNGTYQLKYVDNRHYTFKKFIVNH